MEEGIRKYGPDIVINVGQAGGRSCVTIEQVALNLAEACIPDNDGEQPSDMPLQENGEPAYYATIPVKAIVKNIRAHKIPCHISYTAGTYVQQRYVPSASYGRDEISPYPRRIYPCALCGGAGGRKTQRDAVHVPWDDC